jgi:agmatinase
MNVDPKRVVNDDTVQWMNDHWSPTPSAPGHPLAFEFLSIPFDYAVSHRPGTRFGPRAILDALGACSLYNTDKDVDLAGAHLHVRPPVEIVHSLPESYRRMEEAVAALSPHAMIIVLGGDHSIADPVYRGLLRRTPGKKPGIIQFDAHFDSREPVPGKEHSGHWLHTLQDVVDFGSVVQLGLSAPIYSREYRRSAERNGVLVRTPYEIRRAGWRKILDEAVSHASRGGETGFYLSIDIDCLDQAYAPGTSVPSACGLLAHEVVDAAYELGSSGLALALDVNEVSPPLDQADTTAQLAARIVLDFMAGVSRGRRLGV